MSTLWPLAERGAQDVRDQVRLGLVILADAAARAGDVEVAQADRPDPVREAERRDHLIDRQLRRPVGVLGAWRRRLGDRHLSGWP